MRADDTPDLEPDDDAVEIIGAPTATPASGAEELAGALLGLSGEAAKLHILLAETDEDDFRVIRHRLAVFMSMVAGLPTSPRPKRRIGFGEPKRRKGKGKR